MVNKFLKTSGTAWSVYSRVGHTTWVDLPEFFGVLASWAVTLLSEAVSRLIWPHLWNVRDLNQVIKL